MRALRIPEDQVEKIRAFLEGQGFRKRQLKNATWSYEGKDVYLNMYPSGTLLVQGKGAERWTEAVLSQIEVPEGPIVGCDEVGKGDIFGPLVLCCAVVPPESFKEVLKLNPKDSKLMDDRHILKKAKMLKNLVKRRCIVLMPERFNELYEEYKNINRLMDDAYTKILRRIMEEFEPTKVVVDGYSSRNPFQSLGVEFVEKGEKDIAVSVASMIAREKFLKKIKELEKSYGVKIPKGASGEAKHEAQKILSKDPELARKLVKLSFLD